ncbi:MAG: hypothetical protein DRI90_28290, partial [Deltaproteobacteria bacterium]
CDDDDQDVHPGAEEICDDSVDNDCDGDIDEDDSECTVDEPPPPPPPSTPPADGRNEPLEGSCGCRQAGGRTGTWTFAALLGLIFLRRRHQEKRAA